jgi:hypothetical protein
MLTCHEHHGHLHQVGSQEQGLHLCPVSLAHQPKLEHHAVVGGAAARKACQRAIQSRHGSHCGKQRVVGDARLNRECRRSTRVRSRG